jgi:hypothetical protein
MEDDNIRENVENAWLRYERNVERHEKKERIARRTEISRLVSHRKQETQSNAEMMAEDQRSRAAAVVFTAMEREMTDKHRQINEMNLLCLITKARKDAKAAGAVLSTPLMRGKDRLAMLLDRTATANRERELTLMKASKKKEAIDTKRVRYVQ